MVLCSSFKLSEQERVVLERGLSFIPTPDKIDRLQLRQDLHNYHRKIKILDHFDYSLNQQYIPFVNPSVWEPETNSVSEHIKALISRDVATFSAFRAPSARVMANRVSSSSNITGDQKWALAALRKLDNVIIKPADKGGQIVLQDRTDYLLEANRQLQETPTDGNTEID